MHSLEIIVSYLFSYAILSYVVTTDFLLLDPFSKLDSSYRSIIILVSSKIIILELLESNRIIYYLGYT